MGLISWAVLSSCLLRLKEAPCCFVNEASFIQSAPTTANDHIDGELGFDILFQGMSALSRDAECFVSLHAIVRLALQTPAQPQRANSCITHVKHLHRRLQLTRMRTYATSEEA